MESRSGHNDLLTRGRSRHRDILRYCRGMRSPATEGHRRHETLWNSVADLDGSVDRADAISASATAAAQWLMILQGQWKMRAKKPLANITQLPYQLKTMIDDKQPWYSSTRPSILLSIYLIVLPSFHAFILRSLFFPSIHPLFIPSVFLILLSSCPPFLL